jgi:hypothetical protein
VDSVLEIMELPKELPQNVKLKRAFCTVTDGQSVEKLIIAIVNMDDGTPLTFPTESLRFKFLVSIQQKGETFELTFQQHSSAVKDMLILSAEIFPQINVLWIGCLIMVIGTTMAIRHRMKLAKSSK